MHKERRIDDAGGVSVDVEFGATVTSALVGILRVCDSFDDGAPWDTGGHLRPFHFKRDSEGDGVMFVSPLLENLDALAQQIIPRCQANGGSLRGRC